MKVENMITIEIARSWYPASDAVHGFDHVLRVYHLAECLAQIEGADLEIVRAAALLHDASSDQWSVDSGQMEVDSGQGVGGSESAIEQIGNRPAWRTADRQSAIGNLRLTHHHASAEFAAQVLEAEGWPEEPKTSALRESFYLMNLIASYYREKASDWQLVESSIGNDI